MRRKRGDKIDIKCVRSSNRAVKVTSNIAARNINIIGSGNKKSKEFLSILLLRE